MAEPQTRELPPWAGSVGVAVSLVAMIAWSFSQRWDVLGASPFPLGVDGYFYPVQLRSLFEHGELQYPASPLGFWLLAPFAAATDPITGAKVGAALLGAMIALPAYGVGSQLGRTDVAGSGRGPGLVAAALAVSSSGSMYLSIEFVKNGIGLTVALAVLWLVLRCLDAPTRSRVAVAAAGVIAAGLAHKMAAGIVIAVALPAVVVHARARRGARVVIAVAGAIIVALVVAGVIAPQRFLSTSDLALLDGLFTSDARWSLPMLGDRLQLSYEPLIALVIALAAAGLLLYERRATVETAATWALIALAVFIGLPWLDVDNPQGLGMRLRVVAFVPLALCAAVVLRVGLPLVLREPAQRLGACLVVAAFAIFVRTGGEPRTEGQVVTHPALVTATQALAGRIPEGDTAIVPERHIAFMVAWYARARISIRPEMVPADRRWRVVNLAFIRRTSPSLDRALIDARPHAIGLHPSHPNGLVLVPEAAWQLVVKTLPDAEQQQLERWPTI